MMSVRALRAYEHAGAGQIGKGGERGNHAGRGTSVAGTSGKEAGDKRRHPLPDMFGSGVDPLLELNPKGRAG